jgi:hypothetical protein
MDWTEQLPEKPNGLSFWCFIRTQFQANSVFSEIERIQRYFGFSQTTQPTVLSGYVPRSVVRATTRRKLGGSLFLKDAQADYLWRDTRVLEVHPCL